MSIAMWKLEKDLCRCCHAEGSFKNLSEPCFQLGQEEVYLDMLQECLDIKIIPITGELSDVTYTICESCIARLRDASNFKRQVMDCEERFKDMYSRNLIRGIGVKEEPIILSDSEDMKQELQSMDDDDDDDDAFLKFDDDTEGSELTVSDAPKPKSKSKPKTKTKEKQPAKKQGPKKVKEEPPVTEAAVSGEKKKGRAAKHYTVTADRQYACNHCHKPFRSQPLVSQHYRFVHLKRRPRERKCPHCDAKIPGHQKTYHLEEAHGIPAPKCNVCNKRFRFPCHLLQHQKKVHMGEKTFVCGVCDKSFFDKPSLKLHMVTHSSEKKYRCDQCQREFRWRHNLKDHVRIHVGDRRYSCPVCGKTFVQKSTLKQHALRNHRGVDVGQRNS